MSHDCEFATITENDACGAPAHFKVKWVLWPFRADMVNEEGQAVAKFVWLCAQHYDMLAKFYESYPQSRLNRDGFGTLVDADIPLVDLL
jgi:hypothetical protein